MCGRLLNSRRVAGMEQAGANRESFRLKAENRPCCRCLDGCGNMMGVGLFMLSACLALCGSLVVAGRGISCLGRAVALALVFSKRASSDSAAGEGIGHTRVKP